MPSELTPFADSDFVVTFTCEQSNSCIVHGWANVLAYIDSQLGIGTKDDPHTVTAPCCELHDPDNWTHVSFSPDDDTRHCFTRGEFDYCVGLSITRITAMSAVNALAEPKPEVEKAIAERDEQWWLALHPGSTGDSLCKREFGTPDKYALYHQMDQETRREDAEYWVRTYDKVKALFDGARVPALDEQDDRADDDESELLTRCKWLLETIEQLRGQLKRQKEKAQQDWAAAAPVGEAEQAKPDDSLRAIRKAIDESLGESWRGTRIEACVEELALRYSTMKPQWVSAESKLADYERPFWNSAGKLVQPPAATSEPRTADPIIGPGEHSDWIADPNASEGGLSDEGAEICANLMLRAAEGSDIIFDDLIATNDRLRKQRDSLQAELAEARRQLAEKTK